MLIIKIAATLLFFLTTISGALFAKAAFNGNNRSFTGLSSILNYTMALFAAYLVLFFR